MDVKKLENLLAIVDMVPEAELPPDHEDYDEDCDNRVLSRKQLMQVKKAAEFFNDLARELDHLDYKVRRELGENIADSDYWSASSFIC